MFYIWIAGETLILKKNNIYMEKERERGKEPGGRGLRKKERKRKKQRSTF